MQVDLKGKFALVTGSAHRVGRAVALTLARQGCTLMIHYNGSADKAAQTIAEARALGVRVESFRADMGDPAAIAALFSEIESQFGRLDILVNSAAIFDTGDLATLPLEDWNRSLQINLTGPFLCTQHAARLMNKDGIGGAIVNISDLGGLLGSPDYPQHSVSKAGLLMLTRLAARSLGPTIRVNAVVPGMVIAPPDYSAERWAKAAMRLPLQRDGSGDDVGRAVAYLVSEDFLTGVVLTIDGGEYLG